MTQILTFPNSFVENPDTIFYNIVGNFPPKWQNLTIASMPPSPFSSLHNLFFAVIKLYLFLLLFYPVTLGSITFFGLILWIHYPVLLNKRISD